MSTVADIQPQNQLSKFIGTGEFSFCEGYLTAAAATDQQRFEMCESLRRILQLSADATIEDINQALAAIDAYRSRNGTALSAAEEEVRQRLGISRERWLQCV